MRFPLVLAFLVVAAAFPAAALAQQGQATDEMQDANRAAAILAAERLKRDRPDDWETCRRIRRRDVLVVSGAYDHVDLVLRELSVPYAEIRPGAVASADLGGVEIILVNCPGKVGPAGVAKLREFVHRGGLLFTTDWALKHLIEPAFPRTVAWPGRPTEDDVVAIRVVKPEHLFLRHLVAGDDSCVWWLENASYPIRVLDRRRVEVLIDSGEMERKYGEAPIAVTFRAGRGRVVHVVSHFYLQRAELRGDRDRIPAKRFAEEELGFAPESPAARRLARSGLADVPAGEVRSALAAQHFLLNVLVAAKRAAGPEPRPESASDPEPRPAPADGARTAREVHLREAPAGEIVKLLAGGLRLTLLGGARDGWLEVATPAGERGWVPVEDVKR